MSTLRILLGPSGSGKSRAMLKRLIERAEADPGKNFIVMVPEQVSHSVTDALISMSDRKGILNIDVLSFQRLSHRIFDNAGGNAGEIIDDTGKNLILKGVIREQEKNLTVLRKNISRTGYINEIKSIISEFVQYGISPEELMKLSENTDKKYLSMKLRDIAVLYKAFREKTEERYVTREELLDWAAEAAGRAAFLKGAEIFLDDFTGFTPIQYRFLEAIFRYVDEVSLCLDYDGEDGDLFALSVNTVERMRRIASDAGFKVETLHFYDNKEGRFKLNPGLSRLEKNLFRRKSFAGGKLGSDKEGKIRDSIRIIRTTTPENEVAFVISEILRLIREGFRYREIGIVMSEPGEYARLLKEASEREGLPLFIDSTTELMLNPYTEFIRSALNAVAENMSYESVFHFIRTGFTDLSTEEADMLENYVRAMNIKGRKKYAEPFVIHTAGITEEELIRVNSAREKLWKLLDPLIESMQGGKKSARYFTEELKRFIDRSGIREKTERLAEDFEKEGDLSSASVFSRIGDKVDELFNKIESLIPDENMKFSEYAELLDAGMEAVKIGVLPPGMDALKAGDLERSRMDGLKVLFLLGMNDSLIPKAGSGGGLLSDPDRESIREKGMELSPTLRERTGLQKLYFYMNVTRPSERLYLSFSMEDGEGKVRNPSFFLSEIERIFPDLGTEFLSAEEIRERAVTEDTLLKSFAVSLRPGEDIKKAGELYSFISKEPELLKKAREILDFAFAVKGKDPVSKAVIHALYGESGDISPTRLEKFAECAYRHFMLYGLRAMEREEFGFERRDLGTLLHNVLNICSEIIHEKGRRYGELSDEEAEQTAEEALNRFLSENENVVLLSSERNRYFIKRVRRILLTTVKVLKKQSGSGKFEPELFEKEFRSEGFRGRIDRIDTAEDGSVLYVSVIDYKSGNKAFDLSRIYYALDLQLAVYLNGAMEVIKIAHPDREVRPAGLFYYHIDDPLIKEEELANGSGEELQGKIMDSLKLRGIVNSDESVIRLFDSDFEKKSLVVPVSFNKDGSFSSSSSVASTEDFRIISEYVRKKALELTDRIKKGEYEPEPAVYDKKSPCDYCEFNDCCRFERGAPGFKERILNKIKDRTEIFAKMEEATV
ncbi:MAG: PD-(D/E)XK nuclease family protein [Lachnospiraceae bacterium]|nr:PD-(D/E)XK nuclease family protein [Lachnospiraceae bacterium]